MRRERPLGGRFAFDCSFQFARGADLMALYGESALPDVKGSLPGPRVNVVAATFFLMPAIIGALIAWASDRWWLAVAGVVIGWLAALAPKIARQWERGVVLRLGKYIGLRGPGLFWIIPLIDTVA